jgi:uncharacterized protein (TIGR03437 family)
VKLNDSSAFEGGARQVSFAPHQPYFLGDGEMIVVHEDFSALVTAQNRARAGEVVHLYAVGLGAVEPAVRTRVASPTDPLARVRDRFECTFAPTNSPLEVLFAGLAPGMIGIYQVDMRLPVDLPKEILFMTCGFPDEPFSRHGGYIYTPQ